MLRLEDLMRLVVMMREWHCNSWWHAYYQEEYAVWFLKDDIDDADDDDDDDDNDDDDDDWLYDQEEYAGVTPGVGSS